MLREVWLLRRPTERVLDDLLARLANQPLSYPEVGMSRGGANACARSAMPVEASSSSSSLTLASRSRFQRARCTRIQETIHMARRLGIVK
jgi:hypothetical protein